MIEEKFRWIDNDIDISNIYPKLPKGIKKMITEMEDADRQNDWIIYDTVCDDFEIHTKLLIPDVLSDKEWNLLCNKYAPSF